MKCNPENYLLETLWRGGAGFDCASGREVYTVNAVTQRETADILFANPCKKKDDIFCASMNSIRTTVIDSCEEIEKLLEVGWKRSSLVRIRVEDKGSLMPFSNKFGLELEDVERVARYAKDRNQHLSGVSFHVGSGCQDPEQFAEAIRQGHEAIKVIQKYHAVPVPILDIGGGFTTGSKFVDTAAKINELIPTLKGIQMVAEPGRFFAQTCQDLFVKVIGKKPAGKGKSGWRYTLDESLYGQFSCIPFDHAEPKWIRVREAGEAQRKKTPAVLFGRTCDSVDFIAGAQATEELEVDDWLWFPHMGAYTTVTSTEFNGFPKPPMITLEAHRPHQLPDPEDFPKDAWPEACKYVEAVKVPEMC